MSEQNYDKKMRWPYSKYAIADYLGFYISYYLGSKLHRLDGPAVEYEDGRCMWYYQDDYIKCNTQEEFERIIKLRLLW